MDLLLIRFLPSQSFFLADLKLLEVTSNNPAHEISNFPDFLKSSKTFYIQGVPKKNAHLALEANISGLKAPFGQSWTRFEKCMFSAFI